MVLEFILYFKFTIDAGLSCSLCLAGCGLLLPLFFHAMNKMGWAITIVNQQRVAKEEEEEASTTVPTLEELKTCFRNYMASKRDNVLALDREEFLSFSWKRRGQ